MLYIGKGHYSRYGVKQMDIKQGLGVFGRRLAQFLARLLTALKIFVHFFMLMQG